MSTSLEVTFYYEGAYEEIFTSNLEAILFYTGIWCYGQKQIPLINHFKNIEKECKKKIEKKEDLILLEHFLYDYLKYMYKGVRQIRNKTILYINLKKICA